MLAEEGLLWRGGRGGGGIHVNKQVGGEVSLSIVINSNNTTTVHSHVCCGVYLIAVYVGGWLQIHSFSHRLSSQKQPLIPPTPDPQLHPP